MPDRASRSSGTQKRSERITQDNAICHYPALASPTRPSSVSAETRRPRFLHAASFVRLRRLALSTVLIYRSVSFILKAFSDVAIRIFVAPLRRLFVGWLREAMVGRPRDNRAATPSAEASFNWARTLIKPSRECGRWTSVHSF